MTAGREAPEGHVIIRSRLLSAEENAALSQ